MGSRPELVVGNKIGGFEPPTLWSKKNAALGFKPVISFTKSSRFPLDQIGVTQCNTFKDVISYQKAGA